MAGRTRSADCFRQLADNLGRSDGERDGLDNAISSTSIPLHILCQWSRVLLKSQATERPQFGVVVQVLPQLSQGASARLVSHDCFRSRQSVARDDPNRPFSPRSLGCPVHGRRWCVVRSLGMARTRTPTSTALGKEEVRLLGLSQLRLQPPRPESRCALPRMRQLRFGGPAPAP